jgi:hypothetical protein
MDKRMNVVLEKYLIQFKDHIKEKVSELDFIEKSKMNDLIEYVYEYERLTFTKDDFVKRKRVQNSIPEDSRCIANKSCNERCTRRRKEGSEYCGTHHKHTTTESHDPVKKIDVIAKEMEGIVYYVDDFQNVYRTEDILNEKENPRVVAKYEQLVGGRYVIKEV